MKVCCAQVVTMRSAAFLRMRRLLLQRRILVGAARLQRPGVTGKGEDSRRVQFAAGLAILDGNSMGQARVCKVPGCYRGAPKFELTKAILGFRV